MKQFSAGKLAWCILGAVMFLGVGTADAQQRRDIRIGDMGYSTGDDWNNEDIVYPYRQDEGAASDIDESMLENHGITVGIARSWDDAGVQRNVQIAQVSHNTFSQSAENVVPVRGAYERIFRHPHPTKTIDLTEWTQFFDRQDEANPAIPADAVVYNKARLRPFEGMGMELERWTYAFANDTHDDYIIHEYVLTNTSGEVRNGVYLGLVGQTNGDDQYPGDLWGTYYGATYQQYVAGDATADSMRMWYSWDAGFPQEGVDTRGEPESLFGQFREPQFMAYVVLHADASPTDETDDPALPVKAGWSQRELVPNLGNNSPDEIYEYLSTSWDERNPGAYSQTIDENGNVIPGNGGMYRVLTPESQEPNLNLNDRFNPGQEQEKSALLSFGPYTMQPGEDVRVVVAFAGGMIPHRLAIDAGRAYANGYTGQQPLVPLPAGLTYNDMHGHPIVVNGDVVDHDGNVIAQAGATLDKATKDAILDLGKQIVFETASKVIRTWDGGTVSRGQGSFNIPMAPASPSLTVTSQNQQILLEWEPADGAVGYYVYRDYKRPVDSDVPTDTSFFRLTEVPVTGTSYEDSDVVRGEDYYYYVTAVNAAGVESSPYQNRTGTSADRADEAASPTRAPDPNWQENVVVVPNPFHIEGSKTYGGRRLNFLNTPAYANIHIYTMTGDLVQTLEHDAGSGDRDWERQDTFSTMEIVSGVYLYVVEELDGPRGNPTGEQAIGKFVIIK